MKAEELLSIDFSKYRKIKLDRVFVNIENAKVVVEKSDFENIVVEVFINNEIIVRTYYNNYDEVAIKEFDDKNLEISRKEGRKG
ncbi:hypothetical protein CIW83_13665 [Tissierella sp. P1]|uniref:hypothetical protein n=1 Tax=Tissierella sp. P1 TaxID=1280483 RepID=UPI000BA1144A|nr:hypothetical protein [Tissierella sp. P1]OZV11693.1 hypothetical protein CIW83_13665 [Tissierella sp. P1]